MRYRIEVDCTLSEDEFIEYLRGTAMVEDQGYETEGGKAFQFTDLLVFPTTGGGYPRPEPVLVVPDMSEVPAEVVNPVLDTPQADVPPPAEAVPAEPDPVQGA